MRERLQPWLRHAGTIAIFGGLVFDAIILERIDLWWSNALIALYLAIAFIGFTLNLRRPENTWALLIAQFAIGSLFKSFTIFYWNSGSLAASWPFLLLFFALFAGNEFFHRSYEVLAFLFIVLFLSLDFFLIFYLPIVFGRLGADLFLLAQVGSFGLMFLYFRPLRRWLGIFQDARKRRQVGLNLLVAAALVTTLYFTNILPPVPLSLKDVGIYHSITKVGNVYRVTTEPTSWRDWLRWEPVIHQAPNTVLYAYSAVFAPTKLTTTIIHEWQHYNETSKKWVTTARVPLTIAGGRDGGYRGYSLTTVNSGNWRVNIETERGQLIGRVKFKVEAGTSKLTGKVLE